MKASPITTQSIPGILRGMSGNRPATTGGATIGAIAALSASLVCMSAELSLRKTDDPAQEQELEHLVAGFRDFEGKLLDAAALDQQAFDEFRAGGMSTRSPEGKRLAAACARSPLYLASLIRDCEQAAGTFTAFCDGMVLGDLRAGILMLRSAHAAILEIAEGALTALTGSEAETLAQDLQYEKCFYRREEEN
jgi:formiminotetrahydrofolate cyclodeaminase